MRTKSNRNLGKISAERISNFFSNFHNLSSAEPNIMNILKKSQNFVLTNFSNRIELEKTLKHIEKVRFDEESSRVSMY